MKVTEKVSREVNRFLLWVWSRDTEESLQDGVEDQEEKIQERKQARVQAKVDATITLGDGDGKPTADDFSDWFNLSEPDPGERDEHR